MHAGRHQRAHDTQGQVGAAGRPRDGRDGRIWRQQAILRLSCRLELVLLQGQPPLILLCSHTSVLCPVLFAREEQMGACPLLSGLDGGMETWFSNFVSTPLILPVLQRE